MSKQQKKKKPHAALRVRMYELDYTQADLAIRIHRSPTYVALRIEGKRPWDIEDAWKIMRCLGIPPERMHEYFPFETTIPVRRTHE